jgi:hypothetical protein
MVADHIYAAFAILAGHFISVMLDLSRIRFWTRLLWVFLPEPFNASRSRVSSGGADHTEIQPLNPTSLPYLVPYKRW